MSSGQNGDKYSVICDNRQLYDSMLGDIRSAARAIFLETYIFGQDAVGREFLSALIERARAGVKVKLCVDGVGTASSLRFFQELISAGGEVKIFRLWRWTHHLIKDNNHRNHRKLMVIDDRVVYVGSANITSSSLEWRDVSIRIEGEFPKVFAGIFLDNFSLADKQIFRPMKYVRPIYFGDWEVIRDVPSFRHRILHDKLIRLFEEARSEIVLETPYFVPGRKFRRALKDAARRGVRVKLILPYKSDVRIADLMRNRYLGVLYRSGVKIFFYQEKILHSKIVMIDGQSFIIGSANLDHRSFSLQFELSLYGKEPSVLQNLNATIEQVFSTAVPFNYRKWKERSGWDKMLERMIYAIKFLL